jgi:hypothetical protein
MEDSIRQWMPTCWYMKSSRIEKQLLSVYKTKIAEKHKICSLHLTAIFYIPCCGLYLFTQKCHIIDINEIVVFFDEYIKFIKM